MENTHEVYVNLEIAEMLKKAGFNWKCHASYQNGEFTEFRYSSYFKVLIMDFNNAPDYMNQYSAPSLDVAQRWLREVKGYYIDWEFNMNIGSCGQELYDFTDISVYIFVAGTQGNICKCKLEENYTTIEKAQEAGIKKALELILEKGE